MSQVRKSASKPAVCVLLCFGGDKVGLCNPKPLAALTLSAQLTLTLSCIDPVGAVWVGDDDDDDDDDVPLQALPLQALPLQALCCLS